MNMRSQGGATSLARSGRVLFVWLAIAMSGPVLHGQDLPLGEPVRVTLHDSSSYVGRADSAHDGQIWLAGPPGAIDLRHVTRIEVSQGRKPKWLLGAGVGALAGFAAGAVVKEIVEGGVASDDQLPAVLYYGGGAATGLLIGTGLSVVLAGDRWEDLPPDRWRILPPHQDLHAHRAWRVGLSLSHSFHPARAYRVRPT